MIYRGLAVALLLATACALVVFAQQPSLQLVDGGLGFPDGSVQTTAAVTTPAGGEIATTTTTSSVAVLPVYEDGLLTSYAADWATLYANADVNGDGENDLVMLVVRPPDPPSPPTVQTVETAIYNLLVVDGSSGLTIHNQTATSPLWWEGGPP